MWDLSEFMKVLKMRFTLWYNIRVGRKGTLWEERFKSVLVEGAGQALVTMAAYIGLNPVRAGLVADPKDYRWSGYGEAVAGKRRSKEGLQTLVTALERGHEELISRSLEVYRTWVFRSYRERFGPRRKSGARRMKGLAEGPLFTLRDLQVDVFG